MNEWFENKNFWIDTYPFMFPGERFLKTETEIEKILSIIDLQGNSILDLCCGPGRCSIAFARKGYNVVGVDSSEFLLNKAKEKSAEENLNIEWVLEDMRNFKKTEYFDLVLSMFTSFGYFKNKNDDIIVLKNIYNNLKPGGMFLIDVMGKENLAKIFSDTHSEELPDGSIILQQHKISDSWTRVQNSWTIIKENIAKTYKFEHTIYSAQELIDRLKLSGFKNVEVFGSLDKIPYDDKAERLILVATK